MRCVSKRKTPEIELLCALRDTIATMMRPAHSPTYYYYYLTLGDPSPDTYTFGCSQGRDGEVQIIPNQFSSVKVVESLPNGSPIPQFYNDIGKTFF